MKILFARPAWKRQYKKQHSLWKKLRKKKGTLRFNAAYLKVSDIASQFYDEKKLEVEYVEGKLETEPMKIGTEGHEKLVEQQEKITLKEGWKEIYTTVTLFLSEFPFLATYKNIPIVGKPDLVVFMGGIPVLLFEYKFSKYTKTFISYHVQLQVEGLLLKELGFDTSSLLYAVIIAPPEMKDNSEQLNEIPKIVFQKYLTERKELLYEGIQNLFENITVEVAKFHPEQAEEHLDWAIGYWKFEREAREPRN